MMAVGLMVFCVKAHMLDNGKPTKLIELTAKANVKHFTFRSD